MHSQCCVPVNVCNDTGVSSHVIPVFAVIIRCMCFQWLQWWQWWQCFQWCQLWQWWQRFQCRQWCQCFRWWQWCQYFQWWHWLQSSDDSDTSVSGDGSDSSVSSDDSTGVRTRGAGGAIAPPSHKIWGAEPLWFLDLLYKPRGGAHPLRFAFSFTFSSLYLNLINLMLYYVHIIFTTISRLGGNLSYWTQRTTRASWRSMVATYRQLGPTSLTR